jgi:cytoplasmic iron level regulating protein YaaA (DUF328/UPF0246 family)
VHERAACLSGRACSRRGYGSAVLVLLPPSETKLEGGEGPPLRLDGLSHPELNPLRTQLVDELVKLSGDIEAARAALGLSAHQDGEIARNAQLWSSPTTPALHRYTGVLYDALDIRSLRGAAVVRARRRLAVGSALFGLLMADDAVPAYRLSTGGVLPGRGTLAATWRPFLAPVLAAIAERELVVDLRSGSYAAMARVPGAVTVTVLTAQRTVVSHFNKAHKGKLARLLASSRAEPSDAASVAAVARRAGMRVERRGTALEILLPHG